jgi:pimeloyl-ACP methyl ester carboxylesterase
MSAAAGSTAPVIGARVTSRDGTRIACERVGDGPAVILVDGAMGFRAFGGSPHLSRLLAPHATVVCFDRRGRGESGDAATYSVEREIEDIGALVEAAGGRASLFGISSGGALALEAAASLGGVVDRLAVYEIPYDSSDEGGRRWREYRATLSALLSAGRRGDAVELFMRLVGASDAGVEGMRAAPVWATFEAVAPTLAYDAAVLGTERTVPTDRAVAVTAETLVMDGGASVEHMPFMRATAVALAQAIPGARHRVVEGQQHDVDPEVLAPLLAEFFSERADV